jgi:NADH:ubiquinone oxidoreductase subunit H
MFIPAALVWMVIPFSPDAVVADLNVAICSLSGSPP